MANPVFVQSNSQAGSSASNALAFTTSTVTLGNVILVGVSYGATTSAVSDSAGNTYTALIDNLSSNLNLRSAIFWAPITLGSGTKPTVTVTFGSANTNRIWITEFSGIATTSPTDSAPVFTVDPTFATSVSSTSMATTANANDLIFSVATFNSAFSAYGTNFTGIAGTTTPNSGCEYQIVSSTGSYAGTFTQASVQNANCVVVSLKNTVSGGGTSSSRIMVHIQTFSTLNSVSNIVSNHAYIDTLPFDGIVMFPSFSQTMTGGGVAPYVAPVITYSTMFSELNTAHGVFKNLTHNYVYIMSGNGGFPDPFDDWTQELANWTALAQAARDAGFEGICYDPEEYNINLWTYPGSCRYGGSQTLAAYQSQYRLRGTQLTQAVLGAWSTCKLMNLYGPWASSSHAPEFGNDNILSGYFLCGQFAGAPNNFIVGNEIYQLRSSSDFSFWHNWSLNTILGSTISPPLVPSALFSTWTADLTQGFGIYDQSTFANEWSTGRTTSIMVPSLLTTTIENAWPFIDPKGILWNYSEGAQIWVDPNNNGSSTAVFSTGWVAAVLTARTALGLPLPGTPTIPSGVIATTLSSSSIRIDWSLSTGSGNPIHYVLQRNGSTINTTAAGVITYTDNTGLSSGTTYSYQIQAVESAGKSSAFSSTASGTTSTAVPTVTFSSPTSPGSTTITLNGSITATNGAAATIVGFQYGLSSFTTTVQNTGSFGVQSFSYPVTGLTSGTHYVFEAFATNSAGTGFSTGSSFNTNSSNTILGQGCRNPTDPNNTLNGGIYVNYGGRVAKGDWNGTTGTDNTGALWDALQLGRQGGTTANVPWANPVMVYLPPGNYMVSSIMVLREGFTFFGEPSNPPTITLAPNSSFYASGSNPFFVVDGTYSHALYDTQWSLRASGQPGNCITTGPITIATNNIFSCYMRDINITILSGNPGCLCGMLWACAQDCAFRNCVITCTAQQTAALIVGDYGIQCASGGGGNPVINVTCTGGQSALIFGPQSYTLFRGCTFNGPVTTSQTGLTHFIACTFNNPSGTGATCGGDIWCLDDCTFVSNTPFHPSTHYHVENMNLAGGQITAGSQVYYNLVAEVGTSANLGVAGVIKGSAWANPSYPYAPAGTINIATGHSGTSDWTTIVNNALSVPGTSIYFPPGTYNFSGTLVMGQGTSMYALNLNTVQLQLSGNPGLSVTGAGSGQGVTIVNVCIACNSTTAMIWNGDVSSIYLDSKIQSGGSGTTAAIFQSGGGFFENAWWPANNNGSTGVVIQSTGALYLYQFAPEHYTVNAMELNNAQNVFGRAVQFEVGSGSPTFMTVSGGNNNQIGGFITSGSVSGTDIQLSNSPKLSIWEALIYNQSSAGLLSYNSSTYPPGSGGSGSVLEGFIIPSTPINGAPSVSASAATNVGLTTATLNGTITSANGNTISADGFMWDPTTSPQTYTHTSPATTVQSGSISVPLTGFTTGTTYHYVAYATNVKGTTQSNPIAFTPNPPPPFVQGFAGTSNTNGTTVTSITAAFPSQTAGNTNVVAVSYHSSTVAMAASLPVTDTEGNVYIVASPLKVSDLDSQVIYYCHSIIGGSSPNTVTANFASAVPFVSLRIAEYQGLGSIDVQSTGSSTVAGTTASVSPAVTTTNTSDVVIVAVTCVSGLNGTVNGFVERVSGTPFSSDIQDESPSVILTAFTAPSPIVSSTWVENLVAFLPASAVPTAPTVTAPGATSVGAKTATLVGSISSANGQPVTSDGFKWGPETSPLTYPNIITEPSPVQSGIFTSNLINLTPNTKYHYLATATNSTGTGTSLDSSFTPTAPIPYVQGNMTVGGVSGTAITTLSLAFLNPQVSGNRNVVAISYNSASSLIASVKDAQNNSYSQVSPITGVTTSGTDSQAMFSFSPTIAGSQTITVTLNAPGSQFVSVRIAEYQGLGSLDVHSENTGTSGTASLPGSVTTTNAGDVLIVAVTSGQTITGPASASPFTERLNGINIPPGYGSELQDDVPGVTVSPTAPTTISTSSGWVENMAAFLPATAIPQPIVPNGYTIAFDQEFVTPGVDINTLITQGNGTGPIVPPEKFYCHTPASQDFGSSTFSGPQQSPDGISPFRIDSLGNLRIKEWIDTASHRRSGILSTVDSTGNGFSLANGFYVCCAWVPRAGGTWSSFWMQTLNMYTQSRTTNGTEIDIFEIYGFQTGNPFNTSFAYQTVQDWTPANAHISAVQGPQAATTTPPVDLSVGWHIFSVLINGTAITFYVDNVQTFTATMPPSGVDQPFFMMVDLAMGGGWPIDPAPVDSPNADAAPNGTTYQELAVAYIRAYANSVGVVIPSVTVSTASGLSSSTATLNGSISSAGNGTISSNGFDWGTTTAYGNSVAATTVQSGAFSANITNLSANTLYHFRSKASNSAGQGVSSDLPFTTQAIATGQFYVTPSGAGTQTGASWTNAGTLFAIANAAVAGNIIWMAGGTYSVTASFTASGTSGNPITIKRATAASGSVVTGVAGWVPATMDTQVVFSTGVSITSSWLVLDGNTWNPPGLPSSFGILIHHAIGSKGIDMQSAVNTIIRNVEVVGAGINADTSESDGIHIGSNCTLSGCSSHDHDAGVFAWPGTHDILIEYTFIYNISSIIVVQHNNSVNPHPDVTYCGSGWLNSCVRWCVVCNVTSEGFFFDNNNDGSNNPGGGGNMLWYGNLMFQGDCQTGCNFIEFQNSTSFGTVFLYNNTFVDYNKTNNLGGGTASIGAGSLIKNNLWINMGANASGGGSDFLASQLSFNGFDSNPKGSSATVNAISPFVTGSSSPWISGGSNPPATRVVPDTGVPTGYNPAPYVASFALSPGSWAIGKGTTAGLPTTLGGQTVTLNADMNGNIGANLGAFQPAGAIDSTPSNAPTAIISPSQTSVSINLSWTASTTSNTTYPASTLTYLLEHKGGAFPSYVQFATTSPGVTTAQDTGLAASTSYTYRIRAQDPNGTLSNGYSTDPQTVPAAATFTTAPSDTTGPSPPTGLTATSISSSEIDLTCVQTTDTQSVQSTLTYQFWHASPTTFTKIGSPVAAPASSGALVTLQDTGLQPSTLYNYEVQAFDPSGNPSLFDPTSAPFPNATTRAPPSIPVWVQSSQALALTATYSAAQVVGNSNIIVMGWDTQPSTIQNVTDTAGNVYAAANALTTNGQLSQQIWWSHPIKVFSSGNAVTVAMTAAPAGPDLRLFEYSGLNAIDATAFNTGTATPTVTVGPITTTQANDLLLVGFYVQDSISGAGSATLAPSAAPAFVQGKPFNSGSTAVSVPSFSGSFPSNNAAGNSILVFFVCITATSAAGVSVADSRGNVYSRVTTQSALSGRLAASAYLATNIASGPNTITVTGGDTITFWDLHIAEYVTCVADNGVGNTGSGTTLTSGNIITHNPNETLVMYGQSNSNSPLTPTGGFTIRVQDLSVWDGTTSDLRESVIGTYSGGFTTTTSGTWYVLTVALSGGGVFPMTTPARIPDSSGGNLANDLVVSSVGAYTVTNTDSNSTGYVAQLMAFKVPSASSIAVSFSGITSAQSFGALSFTDPAHPTVGIPSAQIFGSFKVNAPASLTFSGITSPQLLSVSYYRIRTVNASGTTLSSVFPPSLYTVTLSGLTKTFPGITSAQSFGSYAVAAPALLTFSGIPTVESFVSYAFTNPVFLAFSGILSGEQFTPVSVATSGVVIPFSGILSAESFGSYTYTNLYSVNFLGITSGQIVPNLSYSNLYPVTFSGITSSQSFGSYTYTDNYSVTLFGIFSNEQVPVISAADNGSVVSISGITSAQSFGSYTYTNLYSVTFSGITSAEIVPSISFSDPATVTLSGVTSSESFNTYAVNAPAFLTFTGISSTATVPVVSVATNGVVISFSGVTSSESFGNVTYAGLFFNIAGITSSETVSLVTVVTNGSVIALAGISSTETFGTYTYTGVFLSFAGIPFGVFPSISVSAPAFLTIAGIASLESLSLVNYNVAGPVIHMSRVL